MPKEIWMPNNSILVKIRNIRGFLDITTISRKKTNNGRFTFTLEEIETYLQEKRLICRSWNGFADMRRITGRDGKDYTAITFYRLVEHNDMSVDGWTETISVPTEAITYCSDEDFREWKGISGTPNTPVKLVFHGKHLQNTLTDDTKIRRAFSKFISQNFEWRDAARIDLYDDYNPYDFFFEETTIRDKKGLCGGVILHETKPGAYQYSIHT